MMFEDFSLAGLLRILCRRKWWILLTYVAVLGSGFVYLASQDPVYDARARIRIGQISGDGPLESADVLASRLMAAHGQSVADGILRPRPYLARALPARVSPGVVDLAAHGDQPEDASALLQRICADISGAHSRVHDENIRYLKERLESIDLQQAELREQSLKIAGLLEQLKGFDAVQASLLAIERSRLTDTMTKLASERPEIARQLAPPLTYQTELLGEIIAPAAPFKPRKALVMALATVLGAMFGVSMAFAVELLSNARRWYDALQRP